MPNIVSWPAPLPASSSRAKINGHAPVAVLNGATGLHELDLDAFEAMEEEPSSWATRVAENDEAGGEIDMDIEEQRKVAYGSPWRQIWENGAGKREEGEEEDQDEESSDEEDGEARVHVHVEVRLRHECTFPHLVKSNVLAYIRDSQETLRAEEELHGWMDITALDRNVDKVVVTEISNGEQRVNVADSEIHVHVWKPSGATGLEEFTADSDDEDDDDTKVPAASVRELPSLELEGLWRNLIYDDNIKERLLQYIHSTTAFSDAEVDFNVVTWNRMILLHGPPGTGKTSLCRGLAQKLSIRLSDRYSSGRIVEINSHSLFSKWFSESGKLVQKLFSAVNRMVDDEDCFVVVMIDEVESLTAARSAAMTGNEPGDAVRVVNALLTQLDKLKTRKNVLVMTTSNIAGAIDPAFVDRADIKEHVGFPPPQAVYWILTSCLEQLMKGGLVKRTAILEWIELGRFEQDDESPSARLKRLAKRCHECQLAGRFLRRLPVLAHARYIAPKLAPGDTGRKSLRRWVDAMEKLVQDEWISREQIRRADGHREKQEIGTDVAVKQA